MGTGVRIWRSQRWQVGGEPAEGELIKDGQTEHARRIFLGVNNGVLQPRWEENRHDSSVWEGSIGGDGTEGNICPRGLDFAAVRSGGGRSRKGRAR